MSSRDLTFRLLGQDAGASRAFGNVEKSAGGVDSTMSKLGKTITAALSVTAIIEFGKKSVEAFLSAEQAQHRLEDAYQRFPALADTNIKSLEAYDAALGKKTTFDKYSIESGQAVLAQFHLTGTQVKELTPLLLDYAAKTGQDVPSAATALGKALLGNGRALKAIGIDFHNTGKATGNYNELVGALRGQVGGFAEKEATTAEGKLKIMQNRFHDLEVEVGGKLIPIISTAVGVVLAVTSAVSSSVQWLNRNRAAVLAVAAAISVLLIPKMIEMAAEFSSDAVQLFAKGMNVATNAVKGAGLATGSMVATLGPLAVVAGVAAFAVVKSWNDQQKAIQAGKKAADDYLTSITEVHTSLAFMQGAVQLVTDKYASQLAVVTAMVKHGDIMSDNFIKQRTALESLGRGADDLAARTAALRSNEEALGKQYHLTRTQVEQIATGANIDLTGSLDVVSAAFAKQVTAVEATHHPMSQAQRDFKLVADRASSATDQVNALRDAFDLLVGKGLTADEATIKFRDDLADLTGALKASKGSMDLTTQSGRDARKQFDQTAQSALDMAVAQKDAGASNTTVKKTLDAAIKSLEKAGGKNAYVKAEVAKLKAAEDQLTGAIEASNAALKNVPSSPYNGITVPGTGGRTRAYAHGGFVDAPIGQPVPAIVHGGEYVISNEELAAAQGGAAGPYLSPPTGATANVYVTIANAAVGSPREIAKGIAPAINAELERLGGHGRRLATT